MAELKARLRAVRGLMDGLEEKYNSQPVFHYEEMEIGRAIRHLAAVMHEQEQRLDDMSQKIDKLEKERQESSYV